MIRVLAAIRRRPGMTLSEYFKYIVEEHGRIARANPMTLRRYHQLHVSDGAYGKKGDEKHQPAFPRNSVTELWFDDVEGLQKCFEDPYTREVTGPDGANFSDLSSAIAITTNEAAQHGETSASGRTKVLWFLKSCEGVAEEAFNQAWTAADAAAATVNGIAGRVLAPALRGGKSGGADYFGGADMIAYDGVLSLWLDVTDPIAVMRTYEESFIKGSEPWLDRSKSFWVIGKEHVVFDLT